MNHPLRRSLAFLCALGLLCSLMAAWPLSASAEVITFRFTLDPAVHGESVHINVAIQSDTAPSAGGGFSGFTITIYRQGTVLVNTNYQEPNDRVIMGIALSIGTLRYTNDQPQDQALDFVCRVYRSGSLVGESTRNGYVPTIIHQFTRTTTQQSCTTAEAVIDTCVICGFVERTETAPPLGHDIVYQHVAGSAGRESRHLKICQRDSSHNLEEPCPLEVVAGYPPDCTTPGQRLLQCHACQYGCAETLEALGHDWAFFRSNQDGSHSMVCRRDISHVEQAAPCQYDITVRPPTCTTVGISSRTCQLCQYAAPDIITAPLGHDWGPWTSDFNGSHSRICQRDTSHSETSPCEYEDTITPPACTQPGHTRHTCGLCGHSYTDEPVPALGHDWTAWTSQEDGSHSRICLRDASHAETGPCSYQLSTTHPFCTTPGFTIHTCTSCGHAYTDAHTAPLGHDWTDWTSREDGTHSRSCRRDSSHTETSPCEYVDAITLPTCTSPGFTTHTCAICGYAYTDAHTESLGHDWSDWTSREDGTHSRSCQRDSQHSETATCEHAIVVTPPTCTESGFTTHTCAVCGHVYTDTPTVALGHDWAAWTSQEDGTHSRSCRRDSSHAETENCEHAIVVTPPTCTDSGFTTHTCVICGYAYIDKRMDPLGHDWAAWTSQEDGTHSRSCRRDSQHTETENCEHAIVITPPTCTAPGLTTHTCAVCSHTYTDAHTEPLGHDWAAWTSQEDGTHSRSCRRDSSHTETAACEYASIITPPTCTAPGFTTHTCAVCGFSYTDAPADPLGHRPGDWAVSLAPSGKASGLETRHCLACDQLLSERILPRLRDMRYQNTACIGGPRFRDSLPELTSLWYSYALIDVQQEGRTSYPLIASNRFRIGTVYLDIQEGSLTVSYRTSLSSWHLREEYLTFFPSLAAVHSEDLERLLPESYAFGQPIPLSDLPQEAGQSLLFLRLLLDYDAFDEGLAASF